MLNAGYGLSTASEAVMGLQTGAIPDSEVSPRWISESQHLSISGATAAAKQLARGLEGGGEEQDLYREKATPRSERAR